MMRIELEWWAKPNNPLNFGTRDAELQDYCSLVHTPKVNIFTLFDGSTYATTYYMVEIYNKRLHILR